MRVSGISAFTKNVTARTLLGAGATALTLSAALPLLPGGAAAWACGDDAPTTVSAAPEPRHATDPISAFLPPAATSVTAGSRVEMGVEMVNTTGSAYQRIAPGFAVFGSADSGTPGRLVNLQPSDVNLDVMLGGSWHHLPLHHTCDPTLGADTSVLQAPLEDGHAHRYLFRLGLSATAPKQLKQIEVYSGFRDADRRPNMITLKINRPAAVPPRAPTTAPGAAPTTAPTTAPASTAVPAAVLAAVSPAAPPAAAASGTPAPTAPAAGTEAARTELAHTGPSAPVGFLFGSAAACVAFGAGVLHVVRRRFVRR
ncbi:hypothetical protein GCM10009760_44390 [Kitasatospora kazusensis]|uniref:LPXTG-motif cell wall-anchored protein n=1 Tax=Kitasatospora kazusensis TaxID=407974 RepID=A0ABP5LRY1_9ACTN